MREYLKSLRKGRCISQEELGNELGISRISYRLIEDGTTKSLKAMYIPILSRVLRVPQVELMRMESEYGNRRTN